MLLDSSCALETVLVPSPFKIFNPNLSYMGRNIEIRINQTSSGPKSLKFLWVSESDEQLIGYLQDLYTIIHKSINCTNITR